jgi:HD superfamily phosphohydrolase
VPDILETLNKREQMLFLCAALLHDIGHGAYSHAFEDIFGVNHENIGAKIISSHSDIKYILDKIDENFADDLAGIIKKDNKFPLIETLISSQLDVDRLDYLERDAYFTGTAYGKIDLDRLIRVLNIRDNKVVFKISGIHAIENYLISRYHMYWQVYYHPVARSYEVILEKIYQRIKDLLNENYPFEENITPLKLILENPNNIDAMLETDDFYVNGLIMSFKNTKDTILRNLANDFLNRNIWGYIDNTEENQNKIKEIISKYTELEQKYYYSFRSVENSTYKNDEMSFGDEILILLENGNISTLNKQSKIIESLAKSGTKKDLKFFYKK